MSTNPFEVVITAAIERAESLARLAIQVRDTVASDMEAPLVARAEEILNAVKLVRP